MQLSSFNCFFFCKVGLRSLHLHVKHAQGLRGQLPHTEGERLLSIEPANVQKKGYSDKSIGCPLTAELCAKHAERLANM